MSGPQFQRRFLDSLPGDTDTHAMPREVLGAMWSRVAPTPVAAPRILTWSKGLAEQLGLPADLMQSQQAADVLTGNAQWPGMDTYAANYGGHQFGNWAGQLGDGRAIVLGELRDPSGRSHELQLKGAGPTAYSRMGDGRAVLRSSIREYLCSEAMHALDIPTTRALSLAATGDNIVRDMFYDGNARAEPGAIVCRVAESFLRFGSYQLPTSRGDHELLQQLVDFTLENWFPEHFNQGVDGYVEWLKTVAERTARLVASWQGVGFVHGVLNTDNMSILGLTIDYGPYGWIDNFDFQWTPNTTDNMQRRYAYGRQPSIGLWNIARLCEAIQPLLGDDKERLEEAITHYQRSYAKAATNVWGSKLGISWRGASEGGATEGSAGGDENLVQSLLEWLEKHETDMTIFFRSLAPVAEQPTAPDSLPEGIRAAFYSEPAAAHVEAGTAWLRRWWQRTREEPREPAEIAAAMQRTNPKYVLRNWLSQQAIEAAEQGDLAPLHRLEAVMQHPFDEQPEHEELAGRRPEWARNKPGCSALSCSS
ncbi:MAG: YdiU family protein [Planctomycetota bacterium]